MGHYIDIKGRYILKIGTTNDLDRRASEHNRNYRNAKQYTMPTEEAFHYDWHIPLSKYNTIRFEDRNRELWQNMGIGHFIRNDRFVCDENPGMITVSIRKTYFIDLGEALRPLPSKEEQNGLFS